MISWTQIRCLVRIYYFVPSGGNIIPMNEIRDIIIILFRSNGQALHRIRDESISGRTGLPNSVYTP
jgi:hypothetical protein